MRDHNNMNDIQEENWGFDASFKESPSYKNYNNFRNSILKDGKLKRKEKELILMAVYAANKYSDGVYYHCRAALDHGASLEEVIEVFESCIVSRGTGMWIEGTKVVQYFKEYKNVENINYNILDEVKFNSIEECLEYLTNEYDELPNWVKLMKKHNEEALLNYAQLRINSLNDNRLSKKFKELILVAINCSESYTHGIKVHMNQARILGATEEELNEVVLTTVLTSGGPAYIDGSKFLKEY